MTTPSRSRLAAAFAVLFALLLFAPEAKAIEYELFIDVDTEDELYDLWVSGQISEDTFNTLVELRRRGVDLNRANRDELYSLPNLTYGDVDALIAYRSEVGTIRAPADLIAAGVLSPAKLGSILTFVQAQTQRPALTATHGWVRYQTMWSQRDRSVPPMALQARVTTLRQLTLGFAGLLSRQRPGNPVWDPTREAMVAPASTTRVHVPKLFAQWDNERFGVIVGSYRIGFGQRLTFDSTNRYTPNGFFLDDAIFRPTDLGRLCRESAGELPTTPCPQGAADLVDYGTRDFRWRDGQRGLAIGAKHLSLPVGWMQLYGFGSWQSRQIYQYQVRDADACPDALSDDDSCSAPATLVLDPDQDPLDPTSSHRAQTLPNMYEEFIGGANFSWFYDRRTHVGLTGYGATALWKVDGANLDFQDWSPLPYGGGWGAVGVDASWGHRWSDLALEVTRSFDSMRSDLDESYGGGGFAALLRHTSTFGKNELELSARFYDRNYANPYAGSIAQADQYFGNRARDEAGGRIRYTGRVADRLDLRGIADVWVQPSLGSPKMLTYIRADLDATPWFRPGLWLQYRNIDLRPGPNFKLGCVDDGASTLAQDPANEDGTPNYRSGCLAEVGQATIRLGFRPFKGKLSIIAQYQHEWIDDPGLHKRELNDFCDDNPGDLACRASACVEDPSLPECAMKMCDDDPNTAAPSCSTNVCAEDPSHPFCQDLCTASPDDPSCRDPRLRQDSAATIIVRARPIAGLLISARLRYLFEDVQNPRYYEHSLWTYLSTAYTFKKVFEVKLRYDLLQWLDQRQSSFNRVPNPEHRLRLQFQARF